MRIVKITGLVLVGILFLIVLVSLFLSGAYRVERSIVIEKNVQIPFGLIKDFRQWNNWSPWHELDTNAIKAYSETTGEIGSWYSWESSNPNVGKGKITILNLTDNELIENELAFEGVGTSIATFTFVPVENGVKVSWILTNGHSDMPWYMVVPTKYINLMMDGFVGPDFEKGLHNLKTYSESLVEPETIAGFAIEERTMNSIRVAGIRSKLKTPEMTSANFAKWFGLLSQELSQQNIKPTGPAMTFYHQYGPKEVDIEAAIPVAGLGTDKGPVVFRETAPVKVMVIKYYGDYSKVENVYIAAYDYLKAKGKTSTGAPMEIYITDPGIEKDTAKWLTEIVFPLDSI